MLPFKARQEGSISSPIESIERKPDGDKEEKEMKIFDFIAEDMLEAIKSNDKQMLAEILEAFAEVLREEDEVQDAEVEQDEVE